MLDQRIWIFVVLKDYEISLKVFVCTCVCICSYVCIHSWYITACFAYSNIVEHRSIKVDQIILIMENFELPGRVTEIIFLIESTKLHCYRLIVKIWEINLVTVYEWIERIRFKWRIYHCWEMKSQGCKPGWECS